MNTLQGKVAIITGAARGQGEAEARLFASEGAQVVLTDILVEQGAVVAADIRRRDSSATMSLSRQTGPASSPRPWQPSAALIS